VSLRGSAFLPIRLDAPSLPLLSAVEGSAFYNRGKGGRTLPFLAFHFFLFALPLSAQSTGQLANSAPALRAIGVLEWTGNAGHPTASRLVPVALLDSGQLQDAGLYLARPQPLALSKDVEYELQQNGNPIGLYDITNSSRQQGSWVGYGAWKPLPAIIPEPSMAEIARSLRDNEDSDRPILHRKHPSGTENAATPAGSAPPADPGRPLLKRGNSSGNALNAPSPLTGLPPDMQQTVAVSDPRIRPAHFWTFRWANPDDESRMKTALEAMARAALGLNPPPPAPPASLLDESFRVFELARGSAATLVLSARAVAPPDQQKYVTLIAQPDLYGNLLLLLSNVTDDAHLDDLPRMRLIDAVDALADYRGELLFELRGATQRHFALYRINRGQAEKLFATSLAGLGTQN